MWLLSQLPIFGPRSYPTLRWLLIGIGFVLIAILDFSTPSAYILAYLYILPLLAAIAELKPRFGGYLIAITVLATLLNLLFPVNVLSMPPVVISRLLAVLALVVSGYFMMRFTQYAAQIKEQELLLIAQHQLSQVREDFIATLTHDLKTPLLGQQQALHYLVSGTLGQLTPEQVSVVEVLQRSNQRQLDLVQNLVNSYRHDLAGVELQLADTDMDELIADVLIELQFIAQERGIHFDYRCLQAPQTIKADSRQLKRVLANVIHNALNYTPNQGSITIRLSVNHDLIHVSVSDAGPGIKPEELERVFQRFYQASNPRPQVSTGLGLYLSRQIIEAHRGRLWAENITPNGSRFIFTLPYTP